MAEPTLDKKEPAVDAVAADPTNGSAGADALPAPPPVPTEDALRLDALPKNLLQRVDYILQHPGQILEALRRDEDLWSLARLFLGISIASAAVYGVVMGGSNWLQGSSFTFGWEFLMMVVTGIKVPVLFLLTLLIVVFPVHVSSRFVGVQISFSQMVTLLLASLAMTTLVLASMASVAFFFALTTRSYTFIKLMHVAIFAYAGIMGLACLVRWFAGLTGSLTRHGRRLLLVTWLVLYMFVGTQLAWVLRPFISSPGEDYQLFRPRQGNFYENVLDSIGEMLDDGAPSPSSRSSWD